MRKRQGGGRCQFCSPVWSSSPRWPSPTACPPPWWRPASRSPSRPPCPGSGSSGSSGSASRCRPRTPCWSTCLSWCCCCPGTWKTKHQTIRLLPAQYQLSPGEVCVPLTGALPPEEHVRGDGLGVTELVHSVGAAAGAGGNGGRRSLGSKRENLNQTW